MPPPPPGCTKLDKRLELREGGIVAQDPTIPETAVPTTGFKSNKAAVALTMGILLSIPAPAPPPPLLLLDVAELMRVF